MDILEKTKKLRNENKILQQQLHDAKESIAAIRTKKVDALVISDKKRIKVYTETTADKTYRVLIEKMNEGAVTINKNGTILYSNASFANMLKLPLQKVIGTKFKNFIEPTSKEQFETLLKKGWESNITDEVNLISKDRKIIPALISINTLKIDTDFVLSIILSDLTQLKNNEKCIRDLAAIVESSDDAIITKSLDGTIKSWNKGSEKLFGYTAKEAIGQNISLIIPNEYINEERQIIKRIRKNEIIHYETVRNKKNGEQFHISITISPLKDEAGNIIGASKIARDITSRKKSEEELIRANKELAFQNGEKEKLATELRVINKELAFQNNEKEKRTVEISRFFQHATEGILVANEEGEIIKINLSAEKLFGYEKNELIGKKIEKLVPKRFSKVHVAHRNDFNRHPQARSMGLGLELFGLKKGGSEFPLEISLNPYSTSQGNFVIAYIMDITIRKKAEAVIIEKSKALEQSNIAIEKKNLSLEKINKELEALTFVSSHDLQEPMRKIKNFASVLLDEEERQLSDSGKNYLRRMYQTADGMQELIENLLKYSRTKTAERKFEKIDLSIIIDEVKKDFEELIHYKKAVIEVSNLGELNIIRFQFRQLIENLIDNSLKFSKPRIPPHIKIKSKIVQGVKLKNDKLSPEIDYCHITYTDNGIGFDPKYNERIFEILQRLHSKEKYKGTGIGLATCKRIVENHNGIITATGKLNKGARFDIYIPKK